MTLNKVIREQVRVRANYRCEYCGVSETNAGGLLTIDHFRPKSKDGADDLENLIYCCIRCNSYKYDYYHTKEEMKIWNPRKDSFNEHFFVLDNGELASLTSMGKMTIELLRLNRPSLVAYRLEQKNRQEETDLLKQYQNLTNLFHQANQELNLIVNQQQELLELQQQLLKVLLENMKNEE